MNKKMLVAIIALIIGVILCVITFFVPNQITLIFGIIFIIVSVRYILNL